MITLIGVILKKIIRINYNAEGLFHIVNERKTKQKIVCT